MRVLNRRSALLSACLGAAAVALAACSGGGGGAAAEGDMALGAAEGAAVTVVEYASVTCTHCALWNETVMPEFKAKYVDTNQVRFVFRELPTPPVDVATAGFLLARCAGEDRYFEVVDAIMRAQDEIFAGQGRAVLVRVAQSAGLNEEEFTQCVTDEDAISAMEGRVRQAQQMGVTGTPAFYVNGDRVGDISMEGLSATIDPLLANGEG